MLIQGRLQCLRSGAQHGTEFPLAVTPGRRPSEKARGHSETHAPQKDCRLQRAASSALEALALYSSEPKQVPGKTNIAAIMEATNVNNKMLRRAFTPWISDKTFEALYAKRWPWVNAIWAYKKPPVFQRNRHTVNQSFEVFTSLCGCLLIVKRKYPPVPCELWIWICLQMTDLCVSDRSDLIFQSSLPRWLLRYAFVLICNSRWITWEAYSIWDLHNALWLWLHKAYYQLEPDKNAHNRKH